MHGKTATIHILPDTRGHPPLTKKAIIIVKLKKENMNRMLDVVNSESLEGRVQEPQWSFRPKELSVK